MISCVEVSAMEKAVDFNYTKVKMVSLNQEGFTSNHLKPLKMDKKVIKCFKNFTAPILVIELAVGMK